MRLTELQRKELNALEEKAHAWAEQACNEEVTEETDSTRELDIRLSVKKILGFVPQGFFWNRDPRGYALKIDNDNLQAIVPPSMQKDWGGFGLLGHAETMDV